MTRRHTAGFTTLEIIGILLFSGILIAVVAVGYQGVQARNRNHDRAKSVDAIQQQLEAYYQENAHYPSRRDMNNADWLRINMKSLDTDLLRDPAGATTTLNDTPVHDAYAYQPVTSSNADCEANDVTCRAYTLTALLEGGGSYVKHNND